MNQNLIDQGVIQSHQSRYHNGFNLLNAFFFPRVSRQRLLTLSKMIDFFFLCDDIYDTSRRNGSDRQLVADLLTTNVEILRTGRLPRHPDTLNIFAWRTGQDFADIQTPLQRRRLADSVEDYLLKGSFELMKFWSGGKVPDVRTYREIRQYDVAMYATIDVTELAGGIEIPEEIYQNPIIRRLRREANLQVAMANDILSYHKEVIRDQCPFNMVHIVSRQRGKGFEQAVLEVADMVNEHTCNFLALESKIPSWGKALDVDVQTYIQGMKDLMGGNWYWSLECNRYNSADSPFLELRNTTKLLRHKSKGHLVHEYPQSRARRRGLTGSAEVIPFEAKFGTGS